MIKVQIIETGEIKEVTRNEAHGLIDSGKATLYNLNYKSKPILPKEGNKNNKKRGYTIK